MGNQQSSADGPNALAIWAVAKKLQVDKLSLLKLRDECSVLSNEKGDISHDSFDEAMVNSDIDRHEDREILNLLFTMWDSEGDEAIPYRKFMVGISPLACADENDLEQIIKFALEVSDVDDTGNVDRQELEDLIQSIVDIAAYFGDDTLNLKRIRRITEFVFKRQPKLSIPHHDCIERLSQNIHVRKFVEGRINSSVRFSPDVQTPKPRKPKSPRKKSSLRIQTDSPSAASASPSPKVSTPSPTPRSILKTSTVRSRSVVTNATVGAYRGPSCSPKHGLAKKNIPESPFGFMGSILDTPSWVSSDSGVDTPASFFSCAQSSPANCAQATPQSLFSFPTSPANSARYFSFPETQESAASPKVS